MREYSAAEINFIRSSSGIPKFLEFDVGDDGSLTFYSGIASNVVLRVPEKYVNREIRNEKERLANEIMNLQTRKNVPILRVPIDECKYLKDASTKEPEAFHSAVLRYRSIVNSDIWDDPLVRLQGLHKAISSVSNSYTILWPLIPKDAVSVSPNTLEDPAMGLIAIPNVPEFGVPAFGKSMRAVRERQIGVSWLYRDSHDKELNEIGEDVIDLDERAALSIGQVRELIREENDKRQKEELGNNEASTEE